MNEKAIKKYNHVDVLTPMVYAFNLSGCRLLVFAYIHGFCRDESSVCYSSLTRIAETIGYARRTVEESIKNLRADGYIYKVGTTTIDGQEVNGYRTYFYELMDRYDSGEDIHPAKLKTRRSPKKSGREQSALPNIVREGREQSADEVGNIVREGREQSATNNTMIILNNNLSDSARTREEEEREFYRIFFLRNAIDPAAEVQRFVGWYDSKGWVSADGTKYDTPARRAGLAWPWNIKTGTGRLPEGPDTEKFLSFLSDLSKVAIQVGGIHPGQILDRHSSYKMDPNYGFIWRCRQEVQDWFEANKNRTVAILRKHYGEGTKLFYDRYKL